MLNLALHISFSVKDTKPVFRNYENNEKESFYDDDDNKW